MEFEDQNMEEQEPSHVELPMNTNSGGGSSSAAKTDDSTPPLEMKSKYMECLKNHAASMGSHALDGCGEFIAAGEDGTSQSLKCAACNCHRNFHRKENEYGELPFYEQQQRILLASDHHHHRHGHFVYRGQSGYFHIPPPLGPPLLSLPSCSRQDTKDSNPNGKKRFRTKFSQEQKEKMLRFSENLGWKVQKQDEESVQQLCNDLGIERHVFKVWMHNNKHTIGGGKKI